MNDLEEDKAFPGGAVVKNLPANTGETRDTGAFTGSGRPPGVGNGNPSQYSCMQNSMHRGAWLLQGLAKSWT